MTGVTINGRPQNIDLLEDTALLDARGPAADSRAHHPSHRNVLSSATTLGGRV
jgi:hypothetical protein